MDILPGLGFEKGNPNIWGDDPAIKKKLMSTSRSFSKSDTQNKNA